MYVIIQVHDLLRVVGAGLAPALVASFAASIPYSLKEVNTYFDAIWESTQWSVLHGAQS